MNTRSGIVIAVAMLLFSIAVVSAQESPRQGRIEGVVLQAGTNEPIASARVQLVFRSQVAARGPAPSINITTDDRGHFTFGNVDPGSYSLHVEANGHLRQSLGQRYTDGPFATFTLAAGQSKTDCVFSLVPAGNVSGRLRDTDGEPLANVIVQLLRQKYSEDGERSLELALAAQTDDRGEFRLIWVTPGRYYLRAGALPSSSMFLPSLRNRNGGAPNPNAIQPATSVTFYPGAFDITGARAIGVGSGFDLNGVDWQLPPLSAGHRVRGRVIDGRTGQPPKRADITVTRVASGFAMVSDLFEQAFETTLKKQFDPSTGVMEVRNLPPGVYSITAATNEPSPGRFNGLSNEELTALGGLLPFSDTDLGLLGTTTLAGSTLVTVADSDIDNVLVTIAPGSLVGRLRVEGDLASAPGAGQRFTVQLVSLRGRLGAAAFTAAAIGPGGSFQINNVMAGEYRLQVGGVPFTAYIKSAQLDGADVLASPFVLAGTPSGTLDIVVSANSGQVKGKLVDARDEIVSSARVVLVPDRSLGRTDLYKVAVTDAAGRFSMSGVAPGSYKAFSWQSIDSYSWFDPEVVARFEDRGVPVHVSESSTENVEVRFIPEGGRQ